MRVFLICSLSVILALFASCGDDHDHEAEGHDHADHEGHDHGAEGHDHAEGGHDHDGHGEEHKLGKLQIGSVGFTVHQLGDIVGKAEGVFTLALDNGSTSELRIWIGQEDGRGSVKSLLEFNADKKEYHGHTELPKEVGETAALWVELTDDAGKVTKGSIPFHK